MTRTQIALLEHLLEDAFRGHIAHSLLANITDVADADWPKQPAGGDRNIAEIVEHVVIAKELWCDTVAGREQRTYDAVLRERRRAGAGALEPDALRVSLDAAHERVRSAVAALDDAGLDDARTTHYQHPTTAGHAVVVIIEHDLYHAGEINHIRALLQSDDAWQTDFGTA